VLTKRGVEVLVRKGVAVRKDDIPEERAGGETAREGVAVLVYAMPFG